MISYITNRFLELPKVPPIVDFLMRVLLVSAVDIFAVLFAATLISDGNWFLAIALGITATMITVISLTPNSTPLRWMLPALTLVVMIALYPIIYTVYISLTNFSDGHRYTQVEAIDLLEDRLFLPDGAVNYYWSPYVNETGEYALWLVDAADDRHYFAEPGQPLQSVEPFASGAEPFTEGARQFPDGLPALINGYSLTNGPTFARAMQDLDPRSGDQANTRFGDENNPVGISGRNEAGNYQQRWIWDDDAEVLIDRASFVAYEADIERGVFVAADGSEAPVDFRVPFDSEDARRSRAEAIALLESELYLPNGAVNYDWTAYQDDNGRYALWLVADNTGETFFAIPGEELRRVESQATPPATFEGYSRLNSGATMQALSDDRFRNTNFSSTLTPIRVNEQGQAGNYQQRWIWNEETETLLDRTRNKVFEPNGETGNFVAADGSNAPFGFWVFIGPENYIDAFTSQLVDGPLLQIFLWTIHFAFLSVVTSFALGLLLAIVLTEDIPGVRILRSILIIPWAIPGVVAVLIWRGMLNGNVGIIPSTMLDLFDWAPPFLTEPMWARFSILFVNMWFAYPYFMVLISGALQSIPSSIYEAATVDGASRIQQFWNLTLPLLLVSIGPLLVASVVFNFNNYFLIEALTEGGPPIQGTNAPPVGHTDNLMTYTFRYAFSADGTRNFGFASAIAMIIFMMVATLTLFQFRLTKQWEEIGENV